MATHDPEWLRRLREDLAEITAEAAGRLWPSPVAGAPAWFNYRIEHVRQVERDALWLLGEVGGDRDVVLAAVWLHDRGQPKFNVPGHGPAAADWARENLAALGFPAGKVEAVCHSVANHSDSPGAIAPEAHEARLLWDADKLAHLGPHEVLTLLLNNLAVDRLTNVAAGGDFPERTVTIDRLADLRLRRLIKAKRPSEKFYFQPSRRLAQRRFDAQKRFVESLLEQVGLEP
ncbi:MAG: HD domain-containing protein [Planctomycetota bacterium]|jgi:hypothetical protein